MFNPQLIVGKNANRALWKKKMYKQFITVSSGWSESLRFSKEMGKCRFDRSEMYQIMFSLSLPPKFGAGCWQTTRKQKQIKKMVPIGIESPLKLIIIFLI